jgi:hypothetical protein
MLSPVKMFHIFKQSFHIDPESSNNFSWSPHQNDADMKHGQNNDKHKLWLASYSPKLTKKSVIKWPKLSKSTLYIVKDHIL